ncbi:MAG: sigma-54 dependent transcriptional regulator [Desulfobacteraceae bacterium]|jgi:DNA-binding NtrC family response regulator|nr:sigma-54 dependent transcriptional regulator [Desulfobacteraceae bacterium]
MKSILVVTREEEAYPLIASTYKSGFTVERASSRAASLDLLQKRRFDLIFIDLDVLNNQDSGGNYNESLNPFWKIYPSAEIIVMARQEKIRNAVNAVKAGAYDYLTYPLDAEELKLVSENLTKTRIMKSELDYLRDQLSQIDGLDLLRTNSERMKKVLQQIRTVSPTKSTVLLVGETGTGKSVLARLIHQLSNRKNAQFISVHCGAIPDTLVESEMFGHEKGAFTGAVRRKLGKFEFATGGTIFLDEIGTISPTTQIKLLQVLQDGTYQRVGGDETLKTDVRVIAASNEDLKKMCEEGTFRKDLYYRLNVFPIEIPPLRERIEDIPLFVEAFLSNLNQFSLKEIRGIHPLVIGAFEKYSWPGNIRELENLVERAYILEASSVLTPESFPGELFDNEATSVFIPTGMQHTLAEVRQQAVEEIERNYLKDVLARNQGKINDSARDAGISCRQLNKLMNRYGIRKEEYKAA